jgi:hypothetical protein
MGAPTPQSCVVLPINVTNERSPSPDLGVNIDVNSYFS